MRCIFPATPRSSRGLDEQSGQSPREFDRFPQGRPGVSHSRKVVPDVSIIISAQHTHTHPQPPRPGMPALCTPALSAQPRPETRREAVVIPTCLLRKPPSPWPPGAGGGDLEWETQTRANNSGPKATHSLRRTKFRADFSESGTALVWNAKPIRGRRE